jgi:formylmethanofuran dehydrogenase subunit B
VESGGTIFRADGIPLALRPAIASQLPADHEALRSLKAVLERIPVTTTR